MGEKPKSDAQRQKKPYVRPEIGEVRLRPQEAVLGNCKVSNVTPGMSFTCDTGGVPCNSYGS